MIFSINKKLWKIRIKSKLKNENFSIICSNCIGGVIYNILGMQFLSPTINCYFDQNEFLKFVTNLKYYLNQTLEYVKTEQDFPVGRLDDINIYFNHYKTFEEAKVKFEERAKRINWGNLFFIMYENDGISLSDMMKFEQLPCKNTFIFTQKDYKELKRSISYTKISGCHKATDLFSYIGITGKRKFEAAWDYIRWLNV